MLLDLDGTLVDSVRDLADALNRLLAAHGQPPLVEAAVAGLVGDGVAVLVQRGFAARGSAVPAGAVEAFIDDYTPRSAERTRPFRGIPEMLASLRAQGWRLAVCTNKPEAAARALLASLRLAPLIDGLGGGDSFAVRKPDPGHLHATLALTGGEATRAVMLGDHANDVMAARAAGMPVIFAGWGYGPHAMADGAPTAGSPASVPAIADVLRLTAGW